MNLQTVRNSREMELLGIKIDAEWRDKELVAVTLTDTNGRMLKIAKTDYSMRAFTPAPPEKKTVHVVSGKVRGIGTEIREQFDDSYAANSRRSEIEQADVLEAVNVSTEEVEIPF